MTSLEYESEQVEIAREKNQQTHLLIKVAVWSLFQEDKFVTTYGQDCGTKV